MFPSAGGFGSYVAGKSVVAFVVAELAARTAVVMATLTVTAWPAVATWPALWLYITFRLLEQYTA